MGEEVKQELAKAEENKEEKTGEEKKEEKAEEKKEEEEANKPLSPFVLFVDLHCMGCAKKIERSILKIRGVEGVATDMAQNQVTIKGVVEPQAVCTTIEKKAKRRTKVLSPLPAAEGEPIPEVVASQVGGLTTVELNVNMHCEACADQLKKKILKMKGVRTAETELSSGKVTVTGTMDANRLVEYVYRRTKKQAKVVPQPEPEKPKAETKPEEPKEEKPDAAAEEEAKPEDKKEEAGEKKDGPTEEKKEGGGDSDNTDGELGKQEQGGGENKQEGSADEEMIMISSEEQSMQKMMYYYQPLYVMERIPPPQLFSDENPNACCIT